MYFQSDYLLRQIEMLAGFIARVVFGKESTSFAPDFSPTGREADALYLRLCALLDALKLNEAENLLFEKLDGVDFTILEVALAFYGLLNGLDDAELLQGGFTRAEVDRGLRDAARLYRIELP
jgi:hypothetical protein